MPTHLAGMTTTQDAGRSARAKRQGRKRHPNGTETFGENERSEASAVLLPTAVVGSTLTVNTASEGLLGLSAADFDTLADADSTEVIAFLEASPSAVDLPGPNHPAINDIAKQVAATSGGFEGLAVEDSTGSWGTRTEGEGAIAFTAATWDMESDNDYYQQPESYNECEFEGTITFDEFNDGYFDNLHGENISIIVDIDFKRLSEEFGDDGGQFDYLQVLEEGANNRADEVHQRYIEKVVREHMPEGTVSPFASPKGRMDLAAIIAQQRDNPNDATKPEWAVETARSVRNADWSIRMGSHPVFDDMPEPLRQKLVAQTQVAQRFATAELNRQAQRRET